MTTGRSERATLRRRGCWAAPRRAGRASRWLAAWLVLMAAPTALLAAPTSLLAAPTSLLAAPPLLQSATPRAAGAAPATPRPPQPPPPGSGASAPRPPVSLQSADLGYALQLPAGTHVDLQRYPHASAGQTREIAMILAGGAEIARLDVFVDPAGGDVRAWVAKEFAFQVKHGQLRTSRAGRAQLPALELALPGGQVEPQTVLFWRAGRLGLRLTLVASSQQLARQAFAQAAATFSVGSR